MAMTLRSKPSGRPRFPSWFASPPALASASFDGFSRPSAREIKEAIAAVENAPDGEDYHRDRVGGKDTKEGERTTDSPAWLHSNAFKIVAVRNTSDAGWDRRLSSREVMSRIRALEERETAPSDAASEAKDFLGPPVTNVSVQTPPRAAAATRAAPASPAREETAEERRRRERAAARARKIEALADKRHVGDEDDQSAVSGMSKRHRMRRKKKAVAALTAMEERSAVAATPAREETEAERRRKERAEARAKKIEVMFDQRNEADDDASTITGISRRHRMRRKKSAKAKAAISPEEQARNEWKEGVFAFALDAERSQWKRSIFDHALNAEATREDNLKKQRELDEQNAAAQKRLEKQRRVEERERKVAARAQRMDALRHGRYGPEDDDDGSVAESVASAASSRHRRRRRARKSAARGGVPTVGEE